MEKVHSSILLHHFYAQYRRIVAVISQAVYLFRVNFLRKCYQTHNEGQFSTTISLVITLLVAAALPVTSVWATTVSSPASDGSGYDIPLGELKKVKKERPLKKETKEHRKRKGESTTQRPSVDVTAPPEKTGQTSVKTQGVANEMVTHESHPQTHTEKTHHEIPNHPEKYKDPIDSITIHHDPYSYVITGKRTTIQAVIGSANTIQAVYCQFSSTENETRARVPMQQVSGTHFTYTTTLPSLAPSSLALRYNIIVVDSLGNETRSQEFIIAVKSSNILPGWQSESSSDKIKIKLENKEKNIEGFSDSVIAE
jgi:hypothetical protein